MEPREDHILQIQWNPVETVTIGKKIGRINGVAALSGQAQLEGRNDRYTVHRIRICWTIFLINKQRTGT